ncbi:hypothetical protein CONLIGDRAFT_75762 [Coniochaeta ligniaria NRRL 30616]|uniref:Uncharacterized protein n=1 Tax=Coniochaeta ligniaria NRRL 30616 TaxID=1408157 RepID=A0A1J7IBV6_9PEZI|nr:hypothetical protein CONLIGDRAFT_75762 [Coniochaeta ligniaria NRRL 30616]
MQKMYEAQNGSKEAMEQFEKDLRAHLDKMQQHLEAPADALTLKLEEERGEIGKLKVVIDQGERERQSLERQLREATNTGKEQEERIEDLVRKVDELEAQPREDPEGKLRSQILSRENGDLKAQLAVKCSSITDLETRLNARSESYAADVASLSQEIMRLTQRMNDREETAKSATDKTLATVQEESRADLQRLEADTRERLQQAAQDRLLVVNQLAETRKKLEAAEQRRRDESGDSNALRAALNEAELRNRKLVEDLKQKEAELENDKAHFTTLWNWAASKAEEYRFDIQKMWTDAEAGGGPVRRWTFFLERVLAEIDKHRGSPGEAPPAGIADPHAADNGYSHTGATPSTSGHLPPRVLTQEPTRSGQDENGRAPQQTSYLSPLNTEARMLGADLRRVTVQSPYPGALTPIPPSVEQEKSRRRDSKQQPKPIMRLTRSAAHAEELRLGQDFESTASSIPRAYGSLLGHGFTHSSDEDEKEEIDMNGSGTPSGAGQNRNAQGEAAGSGIKIMIKNSKRPRQTTEAEPVELLPSPVRPKKGRDLGVEEDDDDIPQVKRAKVQKPKAPASSRRGKNTGSRTKKQKPLPSLANPGVVYGSFPPGVIQGGLQPPGKPKAKS